MAEGKRYTAATPLGTHGIRGMLTPGRASAFSRYRAVTYPGGTLGEFALYELCNMLVLPAPGALGLWLRRKVLRRLFGAMGRNVIIGRNCVFRFPDRIFIGDNVIIDDNCLIDARGCQDSGLHLSDNCIISRGCTVKSKGGDILIGKRVNVGTATHIISHGGVRIEDDAAIAGGCYVNGGTFAFEEFNQPPPQRLPRSRGPIQIGRGSWLATAVIVLDGARIGENAIVSAGSVVTGEVPSRTVVQGNPARRVFTLR